MQEGGVYIHYHLKSIKYSAAAAGHGLLTLYHLTMYENLSEIACLVILTEICRTSLAFRFYAVLQFARLKHKQPK